MRPACVILILLLCSIASSAPAQQTGDHLSAIAISDRLNPPAQQSEAPRTLSGTIITQQNERLSGIKMTVRTSEGVQETTSDSEGSFRLTVPREPLSLLLTGKNITPTTRILRADEPTENLRLAVELTVPPVHESVVIVASQLDPTVERRSDTVYRSTLFSRDDQLFDTLNAGLNTGQHEGGGKSLEVRRFGFNLDHGGLGGGLKVLVDDVQQNQATQGHGQGYLGQLKTLTPELVDGVDVLNGPFSAQYGDFSGLGVVHIRLKESLPEQLTLRLQGGSFNAVRAFAAYSPKLKRAASFIAYEAARTDGPFLNPLRYRRDNLTANYTRRLTEGEALGFKLNFGRNDFFSSGQIPLDEVAAARLDRFGFVDPFDGGRVRSGILGTYYRREWKSGAVFKADAALSRSLFDLYSNFTFFLLDEANGDESQQHDSRLQQSMNLQYLRPYKLLGHQALLIAGGNFGANQINVGLIPTVERNAIPSDASLTASVRGITNRPATQDEVRLANPAAYIQQAIDFLGGHLHIELGLRYDYFRFRVAAEQTAQMAQTAAPVSGVESAARLQPKVNLSYTPSHRWPATFYFNYGRGISSQDARGVVQNPGAPKISTTDFYQLGTSHQLRRFALSTALFLIDRSNEQIYVPDDGSLELAGPSRADGFELKSSVQLTRALSFNGGLSRVMNAFYRGTRPREYVDSAPHTTLNGGLTLSDWRGFTGSLRYRHIGNYRLDKLDARIRATGFDVLDLSLARRIRSWMDVNLAIDNLTNKRYFETQNYFASRLRPGAGVVSRIHATPGSPFGLTLGLTFRLWKKA